MLEKFRWKNSSSAVNKTKSSDESCSDSKQDSSAGSGSGVLTTAEYCDFVRSLHPEYADEEKFVAQTQRGDNHRQHSESVSSNRPTGGRYMKRSNKASPRSAAQRPVSMPPGALHSLHKKRPAPQPPTSPSASHSSVRFGKTRRAPSPPRLPLQDAAVNGVCNEVASSTQHADANLPNVAAMTSPVTCNSQASNAICSSSANDADDRTNYMSVQVKIGRPKKTSPIQQKREESSCSSTASLNSSAMSANPTPTLLETDIDNGCPQFSASPSPCPKQCASSPSESGVDLSSPKSDVRFVIRNDRESSVPTIFMRSSRHTNISFDSTGSSSEQGAEKRIRAEMEQMNVQLKDLLYEKETSLLKNQPLSDDFVDRFVSLKTALKQQQKMLERLSVQSQPSSCRSSLLKSNLNIDSMPACATTQPTKVQYVPPSTVARARTTAPPQSSDLSSRISAVLQRPPPSQTCSAIELRRPAMTAAQVRHRRLLRPSNHSSSYNLIPAGAATNSPVQSVCYNPCFNQSTNSASSVPSSNPRLPSTRCVSYFGQSSDCDSGFSSMLFPPRSSACYPLTDIYSTAKDLSLHSANDDDLYDEIPANSISNVSQQYKSDYWANEPISTSFSSSPPPYSPTPTYADVALTRGFPTHRPKECDAFYETRHF